MNDLLPLLQRAPSKEPGDIAQDWRRETASLVLSMVPSAVLWALISGGASMQVLRGFLHAYDALPPRYNLPWGGQQGITQDDVFSLLETARPTAEARLAQLTMRLTRPTSHRPDRRQLSPRIHAWPLAMRIVRASSHPDKADQALEMCELFAAVTATREDFQRQRAPFDVLLGRLAFVLEFLTCRSELYDASHDGHRRDASAHRRAEWSAETLRAVQAGIPLSLVLPEHIFISRRPVEPVALPDPLAQLRLVEQNDATALVRACAKQMVLHLERACDAPSASVDERASWTALLPQARNATERYYHLPKQRQPGGSRDVRSKRFHAYTALREAWATGE